MNTKHTPGPWMAQFNFYGIKPGVGDVWQINCENHAVCTTQFCYAPETEANARLIAASPELLEALDHPLLREVLGFIEDAAPDEIMASLRLWQDTQRAAIAKATQP